MKTCLICGKTYAPNNPNQRYCQALCKREADVKRNLAANRQRKKERRAQEPLEDRDCPVCQSRFSPKYKNQIYDGISCQNTASKRRQRGKALGKPEAMQTTSERGDRKLVRRVDGGINANLEGDWFPGWDGPWSPSIPPERRAVIEAMFGPAPQPKRQERQERQSA